MLIAIIALVIGFFLGWQAHDDWAEPLPIVTTQTTTPIAQSATLPPTAVVQSSAIILVEEPTTPLQVSDGVEEDNAATTLVKQSQASIQRGEYLLAIDGIEQVLAQVQADYSQVALEQLLIQASHAYLQQLGEIDALVKRDFLFRMTDLLPDYLQYRYILGELLITLEDYEGASYQLSFLANHTRWKQQFDALEKAVNYAKVFQQGDVEIPLIRQTNAWHIKVNIDEQPAILILDTGASVTTLGKHLIADDYASLGKVVLSTANGKIDAFRVNLKMLSVGDIHKHKFPVVVLPKGKLPAGIDGLLGLDWLATFHFVIDEKNAMLRLTQR